jgi:hypothetical protein
MPPDRSPLAEGSEASVLDAETTAVRVRTMPGHGIAGEDQGFVSTGDTLFIQDDPGRKGDPDRYVSAVPREGVLRGKMVRIKRHFLRPR